MQMNVFCLCVVGFLVFNFASSSLLDFNSLGLNLRAEKRQLESTFAAPGWAYVYYFSGDACEGSIDVVFAITTNKCLTVYNADGLPASSLAVSCTSAEVTYSTYADFSCSGPTTNLTTFEVGCSTQTEVKIPQNTNFRNSTYVGCIAYDEMPLPVGYIYTAFEAFDYYSCSEASYISAYLNSFCFANRTSSLYLFPYEFQYSSDNCNPSTLTSQRVLSGNCASVINSSSSTEFSSPFFDTGSGTPFGSSLYKQETGGFTPPEFVISEDDDEEPGVHASLGYGLLAAWCIFIATAILIDIYMRMFPAGNKGSTKTQGGEVETTQNPMAPPDLSDHREDVQVCENPDEWNCSFLPLELNTTEDDPIPRPSLTRKTSSKNGDLEKTSYFRKSGFLPSNPSAGESTIPVEDSGWIYDDYYFQNASDLHRQDIKVAENISSRLSEKTNAVYVAICIPCYNEDKHELINTIDTMLKNFEYMRNYVRLHRDQVGEELHSQFQKYIPVFVPIFDGIKQLQPDMRNWLEESFPGIFEGVEPVNIEKLKNYTSKQLKDILCARIAMRRFQYKYQERVRLVESEIHILEASDATLNFYMAPIIKTANYRKHNSHEWFFRAICKGIKGLDTVVLTDCSTVFDRYCLARLLTDLHMRKDLIGVTARQRVCHPSEHFHPCLESPFPFFRGKHDLESLEGRKACWKCWATYLLSPCPLQGFEFEATLLLNASMFNLVEALPVMPGPCQAMKWEPIDKYRVVDVYFDFLFQNEVSSTSNICMRGCYACFCNKTEAPISFAEFLRTTARLAEDRILSFACVFATGYGTKWILGATFYYIPEVLWSVLLTQRRRWINGTFGTFLFCFSSERAKNLIRGGLHDSHHFLKSIRMIHFLWGLQLYQLLLVLIAPSIFGSSVYIGMYDSAIFCPQLFDWYFTELSGGFRILETFTIIFMLIYAYWSLASFYIPGGKFYEPFLIVLAVIGFIYILPVQFAVWYSIPSVGITVVSGLVIANLVLPIVLSVGQSVTSGLLYASYLWWFLSLILFYLLYIPSYSFARLFDTTWGNRDTGSDSAINNAIEAYMKRQNFYFIIIMVSVNFALTWSVVEIFFLSVGTVIAVMVILFLPLLIQLVFSLVFLFIVIPLRYFLSKRE